MYTIAVPEVQSMLKRLDSTCAVCFDVDSTVITEEVRSSRTNQHDWVAHRLCLVRVTQGIDALADHLGVGEEVAALTASAMGGSTPFEVALQNRCQLAQYCCWRQSAQSATLC